MAIRGISKEGLKMPLLTYIPYGLAASSVMPG